MTKKDIGVKEVLTVCEKEIEVSQIRFKGYRLELYLLGLRRGDYSFSLANLAILVLP